jgi:hypothetical protein
VTDLLKGTEVGAWQGVAARSVLEGAALVSISCIADIEKVTKDSRKAWYTLHLAILVTARW